MSRGLSPAVSASSDPRVRSVRTAVGWTAVIAGVWVLLALWRPGTAWHLAPVLLGAAGPWVLGQDARVGDRSTVPRLVAAAVGAAVTVVAATGALLAAGLLGGPTVLGFATLAVEHVVLGVGAAVLALLFGAARALRTRPGPWTASFGATPLLSSDDVVVVEGNAYFPASALRSGTLTLGDTRTVCPWKGIASYYTLSVDRAEVRDAAWSDAHPLPSARRIKGRVAFAELVVVRPPDRVDQLRSEI